MEDVLTPETLADPPKSWSGLTWRQLCGCWRCKMRYGGNPDVARAAALLELLGLEVRNLSRKEEGGRRKENTVTGEKIYTLRDGHGNLWTVTARELSQMAKAALPWFDWPYGDPGESPVKDEKGKVVKEGRNPVRGYVSPMRDALIIPEETVKVSRWPLFTIHSSLFTLHSSFFTLHSSLFTLHFSLPQMACNNLTWQQYRSLQAMSPQLFREGNTEDDVLDLQAQFLAHCLVPRSLALLDTSGNSIRLRPHWEYTYDTTRAEGLVKFWRRRLKIENGKLNTISRRSQNLQSSIFNVQCLYHICLQCYQTALAYYASAYPLLFSDDGKDNRMQDALQGEVGTVNTVMKYAGYAEQQQVYDSNLPFILDILNTMAKEAKQIEAMNARIRRK